MAANPGRAWHRLAWRQGIARRTGVDVGDVPTSRHFDAPVCRNCGAPLATRFCGECGQEKASRLGKRAVGSEAWQSWRWFEWGVVRAAWRLTTQPGVVAREYVLGVRRRHMHPLKLLLLAIGAMLLVLAQANYFDSANADVSPAMELIRAWSNWAFSLTILALLAGSWLAFARRGGFNVVEHLVLAVYCHVLVIGASILSKLPLLVWRAPGFLAAHKAASAWFMDAVGALVLGVACTQFFRLDPRRDAGRLALAAIAFLGAKWVLLRAYAWAVAKSVLAPWA
jgi:hypothetical protein